MDDFDVFSAMVRPSDRKPSLKIETRSTRSLRNCDPDCFPLARDPKRQSFARSHSRLATCRLFFDGLHGPTSPIFHVHNSLISFTTVCARVRMRNGAVIGKYTTIISRRRGGDSSGHRELSLRVGLLNSRRGRHGVHRV